MVILHSAMTRRSKIPKQIEASVLFENEHTCCICRERGKDVITHHIDGDKNNNDSTNLAVVCLDCHSKITGARGLGRKYSTMEVRKYKRDWEFIIRKKRHLIIQPYAKLERFEARFTRFEIRRNLYELAATRRTERAKEILELLDVYYIFEGESGQILDILYLLVPLLQSPISGLVTQYVLHYFGHIPGPEYTKIRKKDIRDIGKAIAVLTWMGEFSAEFKQEIPTARAALRALYSLFEIVSSYRVKRLETRIGRSFQSIKKAILASDYPQKEKTSIISTADSYLKRTKTE
jgi:hypothetical protein